jgi:DNA-binding response OmpR family regulator
MRLLVVEDDPQIVAGLTMALRRAGHTVDALNDGRDADLRLATEEYDLILLDIGLPGIDGYQVLRNLRARGQHTPAMLLTARDDLQDRLRGLNAGADDYMVKPFDFAELEARIRAIARRSLGRSGADVKVGRLQLRLSERAAFADGVPIDLSPREFGLLECLMLRHGHVVGKSRLQEHLGDAGGELTEGAIEIHIHRLRKKLIATGVEIRTLRGFGYMLDRAPEPQPKTVG